MNEHTFDNADTWQKAVSFAAATGAQHAAFGQKPLTALKLLSLVHQRLGGVVRCRRFHETALRTAYGAGFNGVAKVREAQAKGW